ncbi:hypothetical protein G6F31_015328 [Rhizopus arrhizus]|nr:hypothetical protein G6F31_015328 [Rhizopus arrhizus]
MLHCLITVKKSLRLLDLHDVTLVGFSTGGGEVARYIGRHGTGRVKKAVLISSVPPFMLKTADNPNGLPIEVFDGIRKAQMENRAQLYKDIPSGPFYGVNRPGAKVSQGLIDAWWAQGMQGGHKNTYDSIAAFSATDFRADLKKFDVPTLVIHGDDDQIVPIDISGRQSAKLIKNARLIVYPGAPHGLTDTHKDRVNQDLLTFLQENRAPCGPCFADDAHRGLQEQQRDDHTHHDIRPATTGERDATGSHQYADIGGDVVARARKGAFHVDVERAEPP